MKRMRRSSRNGSCEVRGIYMRQSDPGESVIQGLVDSLAEREGVDPKDLLFKWDVLEGTK